MKKILTLFAMLLVTASTLLAQTPKLSYQMVVRDQNNNLVVNTEVEGTFTVTDAENHSFTMDINAKTNHNGMLSMVVECPQTPNECGLDAIKWNSAKIHVEISAYGIDTTMDVLPVPYALMAKNQDVDITTAQIVKYLKQVDTTDFEAIIAAMYGNSSQNPTLEKYLVDTVLNYIKANKTAVRNMLLNWLSQMNASDIDTVYKIFNANTEVVNKVNTLAVNFIKNHPGDVKEVVLYYIDRTSKDDVKAILDAVKDNPAFDTIADIIADTAIKYIKANPTKVQNVVEYYINQATTQQIDYLQSYAKNNNPKTYNYVDSILDDMIQHYLDSLHYINNADCQEADVCSILNRIETLENSEFVTCPELGNIQKQSRSTPQDTIYYFKNVITNNTFDVNLNNGHDSLIYVLTYPNTLSKPDTILAQLTINAPDTFMSATHTFDLSKGQIVKVYAVVRARCMDILYSDTVTLNFPLQCPNIDSAWNTDAVTGAELLKNNGVVLAATVDFNYSEKIANYGFLVSSENNLNDITSLNQLPEGVDVMYVNELTAQNKTNYKLNNTQSYALNENTFAQNLDMKYCARKVWYRAFVSCKTANANQGFDTTYSFAAVKKIDSVRGPEITLTANPAALFRPFDDSVSVTAQGWFTINSQGGRKTLEYWIENAGDYRNMLDTMYYWWGLDANNRIADGQKTIKTAPTKDTTLVGNVSVVMFGTTCTVTDSVKIDYVQTECNDTVIVNADTIRGPRIEVTPDAYTLKHQDTTCLGVKDTIVLYAASYMIDTNGTHKALEEVKKNTEFYSGLVDTFSYKWMYKGASNPLGTADTLKLGVNRDTVIVCALDIKYKDGTQCTKYDSILVHYEFTCKDSLRTKENVYATIDINGACWTKSNMRDTLNFVHGEQTGDISNSVAKYYNPSTLITFSKEQLGLLYNHDGAKSVCPKGWHLPDTTEWQDMLHYVDTVDHNPAPNSFKKVNDTLWRTTYIYKIGAMNQAPGDIWPYCTGGSSTIKFDAYPAGVRQLNTLVPQDGLYTSMPIGAFWTKTKSPRPDLPQNAKEKYYSFYLYPETSEEVNKYVYRADVNMIIGMSVRCVKGPEEDEPVAETCPSTVTDGGQNTYATVQIGNQCWMKENLRYNPFSSEPTTGDNPQPACTYPGGSIDNVTVYGLLYNYPAATSSNLCPEGWRLPTQVEFETLMDNVGLCNNTTGYVAKALADNGNVWNQAYDSCLPGYNPSDNNVSGFSARPAGWWNNGYDGLGHGAAFWVTPTATNANNYRFYIEHDQATINGQSVNNHDCLSVRCIKANN